MLYQITDGTVALGGRSILSHIDFEIHGKEKIAVVGKNGAGKTTLLRLIAGELSLEADDKRQGPGIATSRQVTVGMLRQQAFSDRSKTVEEELSESSPGGKMFERERFEYERQYDTLFTGFGFLKEDKKRPLSSFSGGEQTKIAFIRLLLQKPDILLLDEPTNHLDLDTVIWLETYMRTYERAIIMVSHDRFFLDQTANVVYELEGGKLTRYPGNYTRYREEKLKNIRLRQKAYERQQEEIERLEALIERFKHKPKKASFARAKKKALERMERLEAPKRDEVPLFTRPLEPLLAGSRWVYEANHLKIGYDCPLFEITFRVRKGDKIGILGSNGVGKSTLLKTIAGLVDPLEGECSTGSHITMGYFDQHSAEIVSDQTVIEHFHGLFPGLTEKEARSILGTYLFGGRDASKRVCDLSGGEKARLVLAELLQSRPNFLVLDEPTNHMDIQAKETLESAFRAYTGTILFVSHDRYFVRQVANSILTIEGCTVMYDPFGYDHYLERRQRQRTDGAGAATQIRAEEAALIAGLRAVPRAERHRLKEIPAEEAYLDWRLRLIREKMETAKTRVERLERQMNEVRKRWQESEAFWLETVWKEEPFHEAYEKAGNEYEEAWNEWNELCIQWYEAREERSEAGDWV